MSFLHLKYDLNFSAATMKKRQDPVFNWKFIDEQIRNRENWFHLDD